MFTGIVTDIGRVRSVRQTERESRYEIETAWDTTGMLLDRYEEVDAASARLPYVQW